MEHKHAQKQELLEIPIAAHLQTSHFPAVFDLTLTHPFEVFFEIKRGRVGDEDTRPLTLLRRYSAFDSAHAISTSLLQLVDLEDKTLIDVRDIDKTNSSQGSGSPPSTNDNLISFPSRKGQRLAGSEVLSSEYDLQLHLGLPVNVKDHLKVGHKYRLQLTSLDLNVRWWGWGTPSELVINSDTTPETLPQSRTGKIVASGLTHIDFTVAKMFPTAPPVIIKLSPLSSPEGIREGQAMAQPCFLITVTNTGSRDITVKSDLDQPYIRPIEDSTGPAPSHARITSQHRQPSVKNFSIVDTNSNEELNPFHISPSGPPTGHNSRRNFTTLKSGSPITSVVELPDHLVLKMRGRRCCLTLRPFGVWWAWGLEDELFGQEEKSSELLRRDPKPPLMLQSNDQLIVEVALSTTD